MGDKPNPFTVDAEAQRATARASAEKFMVFVGYYLVIWFELQIYNK